MNLRTLLRHGSYWGLGLLAFQTVAGCLVATTDRDLDESTGGTTVAESAALGGVDGNHADGDQNGVPDGTSAASDAYGALNYPPLVPITLARDGRSATKFIEYCKALRVCAIHIDPRTIQSPGGSPR